MTRVDPELAYQRDKAGRMRRQPVVLLSVLLTLLFAVGITAAVDLRRLATPRGTALAWVESAVLGDCAAYERLSVPDAAPEGRSPADVCTALRRATATARTEVARIGLRAGSPTAGERPSVAVTVDRPEGRLAVPVHLVRRAGGWRVVRSGDTCAAVGCP